MALTARPQPSQRLVLLAATAIAISLAPLAARAEDEAYDSGSTTHVLRLLAESRVAAYHGRLTDAIAEDSRAIAEAPEDSDAYLSRAHHEEAAGLFKAAAADLDRATAMHPDSFALVMSRVRLALMQGQADTAVALMKQVPALPKNTVWHGSGRQAENQHTESYMFEYASIASFLLHKDGEALADMDHMMNWETIKPWYILSNYCYLATVAGRPDMGEVACQQAIDQKQHDIGQYDSMGFAHLRQKEWAKAVLDYTTSLETRPDLTFSLYGRGIAKRALGDKAGGDADIASATRDEPDIANIMKRLGAPEV